MADLFRLDGRIALVTGASRGLGLAMAEALAGQGAQVLLNGRDPATAGCGGGQDRGRRWQGREHGVRRDRSRGHAARRWPRSRAGMAGSTSWSTMPGCSIASRSPTGPTRTSSGSWRINLTACFRLAREAARLMLPRRLRPDHLDRLGRRHSRAADDPRLRRRQGRSPRAHPLAGGRARTHGHHGQCPGPGLFRHRAQHGPGRRRRVLRLGVQAHAARSLGPAARARRRRRLPGLGRCVLRHRPRSGGGRRDQRQPLN